MPTIIKNIWFSLPVQLLVLHFRRYQIFLLFWYILFATIAGSFMKSYGADTLFLAPEYFGNVNAVSTAIVGFSVGIFIMSWNITTFILHGNLVRFLATTSQPFLKYCINNAVLPLAFLGYYFLKELRFSTYQELLTTGEIIWQILGFAVGLILSCSIALIYFFRADKTIYSGLQQSIKSANQLHDEKHKKHDLFHRHPTLPVKFFLSGKLGLRRPRNVKHYDDAFLKKILSRHHFAAVMAIMFSFIFLIVLGYFNDDKLFQIPAAASIVIFFAILIAVAAAFAIFFRSWSLVSLLVLYLFVNFLYKREIIDPRNKAYGLNYDNKLQRPNYNATTINALANADSVQADTQYYLQILNNWKAKQTDSLPVMYIVNTSGGGLRSATFTVNVLQNLDSIFNGELMNKTLFITGASGGMLGAAYYREIFYQTKYNHAQSNTYDIGSVSNDLLNPIFSSIVTRDIIGPVLKFKYNGFEYAKDRGYAFEEKLNENTNGLLNKPIKYYVQPEAKAQIPFLLLNTTITRDARKMFIVSHPARFLMKGNTPVQTNKDADAVDFASYFAGQNAGDLKFLSALRMNATFPYALPNVWLPTNPIVDVMDAGIRDNYGTEITLRFLHMFKDWIVKNTARVVIIQIHDRSNSTWAKPTANDDYISFLTKPFSQLQNNWFNLQDYYQDGQINYAFKNLDEKLSTICWQYVPTKANAAAGLSFHLTTAEKRDIIDAVNNANNTNSFDAIKKIGKK